MKILFLLGSLEENKNGVADYVLNLTECLTKMGHEIAIISINDHKYITSKNEGIKYVSNSKIRLSSNLPINKKISIINDFVFNFKPHWVSLQFVSFAFQKKGLPFSLIKILSGIKDYPLHIMFHELWIDYNVTKNLKHNILGRLQKICLELIIKKLNPQLITSSIPFYVSKFKAFKAELLPLFGNIKPINFTNSTQPKKELNVVFFGSFSPNITDFIAQLIWLKKYAKVHKLDVKFNVIGNNGVHKEDAFLQIKNILGRYALNYIGEKKAEQISELFFNADLGVSRADYNYFGKSGSTLAMLEHGLPVLLRGNEPQMFFNEDILSNYNNQIFFTSFSVNNLPQKQKSKNAQVIVAEKLISIYKEKSA